MDCSEKDLICALECLNDEHIVESPISLPKCKHYVCKSCLKSLNSGPITCFLCSTVSNEVPIIESAEGVEALQRLLPILFEKLKNQEKEELEKLNGIIRDAFIILKKLI